MGLEMQSDCRALLIHDGCGEVNIEKKQTIMQELMLIDYIIIPTPAYIDPHDRSVIALPFFKNEACLKHLSTKSRFLLDTIESRFRFSSSISSESFAISLASSAISLSTLSACFPI
ncbi:hypothetical protein CIPAW_05G219900 [Carya illinoinensis]|uniref:Uncharacterized protein n=1 Tax=Carya illinoinensis TaxID=32201 RepID=A0A8T1QNB5_CARIL|nr:hypothetical protein CIPAW_05G219900 [Carya illinoinensis]